MSLKLNERYPGRFNNPSADYPQGSFKNRTAPGAKDGSYLEKDWANDKEGFFQSLLSAAGITANGAVDKVGSSQYYTAMMQRITSSIPSFGTAALANITTSATDKTAGRVTKVGDFGQGVPIVETVNANNCNTSGFYATTSAALNNPSSNGCYIIANINSAATAGFQDAEDVLTATTYRRALSSGTWGAWRIIPSNVSAFMRTLLTRTTAADARTDLGVPAGVDKQMCTAWVDFNGTGTVSIKDSFNVSSIIDNGVGDYTPRFTTDMANSNYSYTSDCLATLDLTAGTYGYLDKSVSGIRIRTVRHSTTIALTDYADISVIFFGGK